MRKLKLQMNIFVDGKVTVDYGGTNIQWNEEIKAFGTENLAGVDTILLGRRTADEIASYWGAVADDATHADHAYGKLVTQIPKVVFSNSLQGKEINNTTIVGGDIAREVGKLKECRAFKGGSVLLSYEGA